MSTDAAVDRTERRLEEADGMAATAARLASDRDDTHRHPSRSMHRRASTNRKTALHDLTRYYRNGLAG